MMMLLEPTIASTDTNTQLTTEEVQDIVGGMVDGGTETNVQHLR